MIRTRIKVKVVFTLDVPKREGVFMSQDDAEEITKNVFRTRFERAHLLKVECTELLDIFDDMKHD